MSFSYREGRVEIVLDGDLLTARTPFRNIQIKVSEIEYFALMPAGRTQKWDAEFVVRARSQKACRFPVRSSDDELRRLVRALDAVKPDASLLDSSPEEIRRLMGVMEAEALGGIIGVSGIATILTIAWIALTKGLNQWLYTGVTIIVALTISGCLLIGKEMK